MVHDKNMQDLVKTTMMTCTFGVEQVFFVQKNEWFEKFFARMRGQGNAAQGCTFTPSFNTLCTSWQI